MKFPDFSSPSSTFSRILTLVFLLMFGITGFAQEKLNSDSLKKKLDSGISQKEKVMVYNQLAEAELQQNRFDESLKYAEMALEMARKTGQKEEEYKANINFLSVYKLKRQFATSLDYGLSALNTSRQMGSNNLVYKALTEIAFLYQDWNVYEKVIEYLKQSIEIAKKMGDAKKEIGVAQLIGFSYLNLGDYNSSLKYFLQVADYYKNDTDQAAYVSSLRRLTDIYQRLGDFENSIKYNEMIKEIKEKEGDMAGVVAQLNYIGYNYQQLDKQKEALEKFEQAYKINKESNRPAKENISLLINIGVINQKLGDINTALNNFLEVLEIARGLGDPDEIATADKYVAATYLGLRDFGNARKYTENAILNAKLAGNTDVLESSLKRLAQINKLAGNSRKALEAYEEYVELKDSLAIAEKRKQQELAKNKVEAEKKEKQLMLLQMEKEMNQLELAKAQSEAEQKEQQLQLLQSRQQLLEQDQSLQQAKLREELLEKQQVEQDLKLLQQKAAQEQLESEKEKLQKEKQLQQLTIQQKEEEEKRIQAELDLKDREAQLREQQLKDEKQLRVLFFIALGLAVAVVVGVIYSLFKNRQKNRKLAAQNIEIVKQKDEIVSQRDEIEKAYRNIQVLNEFGQKITAKLNFEAINWTVYAYVNSFMDAAACGVGIYSEIEKGLEFKGFIDNGTTAPTFIRRLDDGGSIAVWSYQNRKTVFISDFESEKERYLTEKFQIRGVKMSPRSLICLPLKVEEKYIGVFTIWSLKKNAYEKNDLTILQTLASYISIALDNASAYQVIKTKNQHITDSIRYGQTIQRAILPSPILMQQAFQDQFVIFKPKDIVSGDYYWYSHITADNIMKTLPDKKIKSMTFIAAVDCTGHGVPGAFMSMIGNTLLNDIINQKHIYDPAIVLEMLNDGIIEALRQEDKTNDDGMDVCLCAIERNATNLTKVTYAGAKRSLYYIEDGFEKLQELKGDNVAIGGLIRKKERKFTNQELMLEKGSVLYLTTDGLVDQNNPGRRKFGSIKLRQLLEKNAQLPMEKQKEILEVSLEEHQQGAEQRDDITMIGVRI